VDGVTGLLFAPGDEHDLARALAQIMSDDALRDRLSHAGRHQADGNFNIIQSFYRCNQIFAAAQGTYLVIVSVHNTSDIYGASRSLHRMLEMFARNGHEVHVVLPDDGPLVELLQTSGIVVHILPSLAVIDRVRLASLRGKLTFCFRFFASVYWLSALILKLRADIVHTNAAVLPTPALAARLTRRPHLWHIREFFSEFPAIWRFYQRYMWRFSTRIITISSAVQAQFEPRFQDKCTLVYNGLDEDAMAVDLDKAQRFRSSIGNPAFLIGVVGRIKWARKGQEVLIKAAALLAETHPEARYVIVGTPSPGNEDHLVRLQQLILDLRLEERVTFTGDIRDMRDVYAAFDVTVVPSILPEPFGCVVMESMAAGTPVIGSRCGGIPEQIVDGVTGLLFAPGDEHDLARALAQIMSDDALRGRLGHASRQRFCESFGIPESHARFVNVFGIGHPSNEVVAARDSA
jgi:glycosyltransferase involved in cell wall biosynthesis